MAIDTAAISTRLKNAREKLGMSRKDVCDQLPSIIPDDKRLSEIETDLAKVSKTKLEIIVALSELYDTPLDYIVFGSGFKTNDPGIRQACEHLQISEDMFLHIKALIDLLKTNNNYNAYQGLILFLQAALSSPDFFEYFSALFVFVFKRKLFDQAYIANEITKVAPIFSFEQALKIGMDFFTNNAYSKYFVSAENQKYEYVSLQNALQNVDRYNKYSEIFENRNDSDYYELIKESVTSMINDLDFRLKFKDVKDIQLCIFFQKVIELSDNVNNYVSNTALRKSVNRFKGIYNDRYILHNLFPNTEIDDGLSVEQPLSLVFEFRSRFSASFKISIEKTITNSYKSVIESEIVSHSKYDSDFSKAFIFSQKKTNDFSSDLSIDELFNGIIPDIIKKVPTDNFNSSYSFDLYCWKLKLKFNNTEDSWVGQNTVPLEIKELIRLINDDLLMPTFGANLMLRITTPCLPYNKTLPILMNDLGINLKANEINELLLYVGNDDLKKVLNTIPSDFFNSYPQDPFIFLCNMIVKYEKQINTIRPPIANP